MTARGAAITRTVFDRPFLLRGIVFIAAYVALDWISYVHPISSAALTPWNPPSGIGIAFVMRYGPPYALWLIPAALVPDLLAGGAPAPMAAAIAAEAAALVYAITAVVLARVAKVRFDPPRLADVVRLLAAMAVSASFSAVAVVSIHAITGTLDPAYSAQYAAYRFWIGDMIGIAVFAPFLLRVTAPDWRWAVPKPGWKLIEVSAQIFSIVLATCLVVGLEATDEFELFHLLFLPIIWIAVRHGLDGTCLANLLTQVLVTGITEYRNFAGTTVAEIQLVMLLLAVTGLVLGAVVSERMRAEGALREGELRLRQHQAALAHATSARVADEMTTAIAHEMSQPLAAVGTYLAVCQRLLRPAVVDRAALMPAVDKAIAQAQRAREILARLRDLFDLGQLLLEAVDTEQILAVAIDLLRVDKRADGVAIDVTVAPGTPRLWIDRIQCEQAIINLLRNALDAIADVKRGDRRISISARLVDDKVQLSVSDTGGGIADEVAGELFSAFATTKGHGMGLGLAISRRIVEAHGGKLWAESNETGATFHMTLPVAGDED